MVVGLLEVSEKFRWVHGTVGYNVVACWNIVSISLLSEKEGKGESIERGFERRREHEE